MAILTFLPDHHPHKSSKRKKSSKHHHHQQPPLQPSSSSWDQFKNLLTCKQIQDSKIHDPSRPFYSVCTSFRDAVVGNAARVVHVSPETNSWGQETKLLNKKTRQGSGEGVAPYTTSHRGSTGMQLRKLSGCYECHSFVDPARYPMARATVCACPDCGEFFPKIESLEHHQAVRHAVSELGPEDSSRNIVEIIFKSSWLKRDSPICQIERILKVHNTPRTIQRFEDYREAVKIRGAKRNGARCAADGNELLRFHCATLACALGARGASALCGAVPACGVCTIIRHGFQGNKLTGIRTTASSGRAHDYCHGRFSARRAMLVCRVIAGRVKPAAAAADDGDGGESPAGGSYDSVGGKASASNLEELSVFSSRAILACFVVIYKGVEG